MTDRICEYLTARFGASVCFARVEIEAALARNVRVIPVILTKGRMPQAEQLPVSMREFAFRNGLPVRPDPDFRVDMGRLMEALAANA
jgi:hypothetical protein